MISMRILPSALRQLISKNYIHTTLLSSKSANKKGLIVVKKEIEEVDDLLNQEVAESLSSLCAPGTESFAMKNDLINTQSKFKELDENDPNLYQSLEVAARSNNDVRLFTRRIRSVHVTYVEPQ